MNTLPPHETDLEERLRVYYWQRRAAPPDSAALWARLAPRLNERAPIPPQDGYRAGRASAAPFPVPTAPPGSRRRFFASLPALAAVLVVIVLAAAVFGFLTLARRGAGSPPGPLDRSKVALLSISMVSASEGWAVGTTNADPAQGIILHYHNGVWRQVSNPYDTGKLRSVFMLSASDGWIVGDKGTILHYQAGRWLKVKSPVSTTLGSVAMLSPDEGWAMGQDILHYQHGVWSLARGPLHGFIFSIEDSSLSGGWAVGSAGTILHDVGGQWQSMAAPKIDLYSVAMIASNVGWAVGDGGDKGNLLQYQDGTWSIVNNPAPQETLWSVAVASPEEAWAVGNTRSDTGLILHYSQGHWTEVPSPTSEFLLGVTMISPTEGWAVGSHGAVLHYLNGVWSDYTAVIPPESTQTPSGGVDLSPYELNSISMVSPNEGWAVGNAAPYYTIDISGAITSGNSNGVEPIMLHYLNGRWTPQPLPDFKHSAICASLGNFPCGIALYSVSMVSAREGWAIGSTVPPTNVTDVGSRAVLLHYTGGTWALVNIQAEYLSSLSMRAANDGWMIGAALGFDGGGRSEILHYDGRAWTPISDPVAASISPSLITSAPNGDLWVSGVDDSVSPGDGFDGNSPAALLHYDGKRWSKVDPHIANGRLSSLVFVSPDEGWGVGTLPNTDQRPPSEADGVIVQYYHGVWKVQTRFKGPASQTYFALTGLAMISASEGWAVGNGGIIMRYANGAWTRAQSPTGENLSSVTLLSTGEGWAVGDHGTILREQGGVWSVYPGA